MLRKIGLSVRFASSNTSGPQGRQSTGFPCVGGGRESAPRSDGCSFTILSGISCCGPDGLIVQVFALLQTIMIMPPENQKVGQPCWQGLSRSGSHGHFFKIRRGMFAQRADEILRQLLDLISRTPGTARQFFQREHRLFCACIDSTRS